MKTSITMLILALAAVVVVLGCEKKSETPPLPTVPTNAPAAP